MPDACPNCGAADDALVPVWKDPLAQQLGMRPDYLGCVACGTMEETDDGER